MKRRGFILGAALVLVAVTAAAAFEDPHGIGYDGRDWKAMPDAARVAYIAGFLAGSATQQAVAMHRANPKVSVDAAVSQIIHSHTGTFPFGVNVYKARLEDYYFYTNNRPTKIYRAVVDENAHLGGAPGTQ